MLRILLVEDDEAYARTARRALRALTEDIRIVGDLACGFEAVRQHRFDVVLIDRGLPNNTDGLELCRWLSTDQPEVLTIVFTALEGDEEVEEAFAAGAYEFIGKSCAIGDLPQRVRHALIRFGREKPLRVGPLFVDRRHGIAQLRGVELQLRRMEFQLLALLVAAGGECVSVDEIRKRVWKLPHLGSNTIPVHIARLREKLGDDEWLIATVPGGYAIRLEPSAGEPASPARSTSRMRMTRPVEESTSDRELAAAGRRRRR